MFQPPLIQAAMIQAKSYDCPRAASSVTSLKAALNTGQHLAPWLVEVLSSRVQDAFHFGMLCSNVKPYNCIHLESIRI